MKRIVIFIAVLVGGIGFANAAVRSASNTTQSSRGTTTVTSRGGNTTNTSTSRATTSRTHAAQTSTTSRTASTAQTTRGTTSRTNAGNTTTRTATRQNTSRSASRTRAATTPTTAGTSRSATKSGATSRLSRAALITATAAGSNTFGSGYNACRDAYFTCMDQFCANMDDTYRRCICSSRLTEIRERERTLSDTSNQLQDFKDLNLDVITKTGAEVKAMLSATAGESAIKKDTSQSAKTLANISDVLSTTKSKALSTQGSLDIAGDINAIWATTDLASGTNLSNLEGETLYNAVHSQCVDLISNNCPGAATLNMVVSAYGMYIENDCTALSTALDKKYTTAKTAVRETQSAMHDARLENYDAHNSASINECIAQVRKDITADTACGTDYVHCMDITGKYLNRETGAALYTPQFFEIEKSVSLDGNVLTNTTNRMLVAELNNKKIFANRALNTCTDLADEVWDEFMRQAITEIYQGQRERVRQVKDECLAVVNQCYDTTSSQLRDFSNQKDQLLIGARLELSEEMCKTKLDACANLYGGSSDGMTELVRTMHEINDQQIAKECTTALLDYTKEICHVIGNDTLHQYPWGCRAYVPGAQKYAIKNACNVTVPTTSNTDDTNDNLFGTGKQEFKVEDNKIKEHIEFTSCFEGYYLTENNWCEPCPDGNTCTGGKNGPVQTSEDTPSEDCGDYIGSLYHRLVRYAMQVCVRPTESTNPLPTRILADVNSVMDTMRSSIGSALATECDRLGGEWQTEPTKSNLNKKLNIFYTKTGANPQWGICTVKATTTTDTDTTASDSEE